MGWMLFTIVVNVDALGKAEIPYILQERQCRTRLEEFVNLVNSSFVAFELNAIVTSLPLIPLLRVDILDRVVDICRSDLIVLFISLRSGVHALTDGFHHLSEGNKFVADNLVVFIKSRFL